MSARVNITISDELKEYFEDWNKKTGIPQSSLMALAISEYVDQKKALNSIGSMMEQMKQFSLVSQTEAEQLNVDSIAKK